MFVSDLLFAFSSIPNMGLAQLGSDKSAFKGVLISAILLASLIPCFCAFPPQYRNERRDNSK